MKAKVIGEKAWFSPGALRLACYMFRCCSREEKPQFPSQVLGGVLPSKHKLFSVKRVYEPIS